MRDYQAEYKRKLTTADEAVKIVKSGDWIDLGCFNSKVEALDAALARRKDELTNVYVRTSSAKGGVPKVAEVDPERKHFIVNSSHLSTVERHLSDKNLCTYIPILYHEQPGYYGDHVETDVYFLGVAPMDKHGYFNLGPQVSHELEEIRTTKKALIVEVNPKMPVVYGNQEAVHINDVTMIVEHESDLYVIPPIPATETDIKIANLLVEQLRDGDCLQLGIGGMPNTVGTLIADAGLKDLGGHSEMFCSAFVDLIEKGVMNGKKKNVDKYKVVSSFSLGDQRTYDFLDRNPGVFFHSVSYVNNPAVVASIDNMVAINNCVEVDLTGQVCSESAGTRMISGGGGQWDFTFGVYHSKGGRAYICMNSTTKAKDGTLISRIKPVLTPGAVCTVTRAMVHYLVTEYGIVFLKFQSLWQRAESIISIAHPDFRDDLIKEAEKQGIWIRSNKR
jgi:butyryl-CoA:acetate CoA-transferase